MILVLSVYYTVPGRFQNAFLLIASYVYYMWQMPRYGIISAVLTLFSYGLAFLIAKSTGKKKGWTLAGGIIVLAGILFVYKYLSFTLSVFADITGREPPVLKLMMPLGISFYIFQMIGYLIDVFHEKLAPERDIVKYALFVSFFPQILSGPIGRATELLPQYEGSRRFEYLNVTEGMRRFLCGAARKIVVADGIGILVDSVYREPGSVGGLAAVLATLLYSVQLYFDFSGYSEMAIGSAKMLGITLRENFKAPYFAVSMSDFWRRWHISLTSWLEDYIFIPLVWSRWWDKVFFRKTMDERKPSVLINIFIIFIISGIWHGAGWNYIIWGSLQGIYRIIEELIQKKHKRKKLKDMNRFEIFAHRAKVFVLWSISLVFFRTATLADAASIFMSFARGPWSPVQVFRHFMNVSAIGIDGAGISYYLVFWGFLTAVLIVLARLDGRLNASLRGKKAEGVKDTLALMTAKQRWAAYVLFEIAVVIFYIITATASNGTVSFIYFGY